MSKHLNVFSLRPRWADPLADRRQRRALLLVLLAAAVIRFLPAIFYFNYFDLGPYNIPWSIYGAQDRFGIYNNPAMAEFGLDYPPVFPFLLSLFGTPVLWAHETGCWPVEMFFIKLFPVLADLALTALVWMIAADHQMKSPWKPALLWALNPSMILNCAFWGQADSFLLFFLLAMFWALERNRPVTASLIFALGCLTKLQMCYFAPVLLLGFLFLHTPLRRALLSLAAGGAVGFLGWLPFMMRGEWFALPLRIYLGGYSKYGFVNLRAANLYAFGDHYMQPDSEIWFWGIPFSAISTAFTAAALLWLVFCGIRAVRRASLPPLCVCALIYIEILFLFTTRQHERYQLPVLVLSLMWWFVSRDKKAFCFFCFFTLITLINQFYVIAADNHPSLAAFCASLEYPAAVLNLLSFLLLCICAVRSFAASLDQRLP